jgi:quinol monooxygenase YgiN
MIKLTEMDDNVTLAAQLEQEDEKEGRGRSVILINKIDVKPEDVDEMLKAWAEDAAFFKKPGFVSAQLHRGIGGSGVFINYAVWQSVELYKRATLDDPTFMSSFERYPESTIASPHLFRKVAVAGICVDR